MIIRVMNIETIQSMKWIKEPNDIQDDVPGLVLGAIPSMCIINTLVVTAMMVCIIVTFLLP